MNQTMIIPQSCVTIADDELDAVDGGILPAILAGCTILGGAAAAIQLGMWAYEAYQGYQCAASQH